VSRPLCYSVLRTMFKLQNTLLKNTYATQYMFTTYTKSLNLTAVPSSTIKSIYCINIAIDLTTVTPILRVRMLLCLRILSLTLNKHSTNPVKTLIGNYPAPVNLNYNRSFGSLAGFFFALQLVTGIFLAMHYTPHVDYAFSSVEHIMTDVTGIAVVDRIRSRSRFTINYLLLSTRLNQRVQLRTFAGETTVLPSLAAPFMRATSIFPAANWLEREV
jgi:hypothetical protein